VADDNFREVHDSGDTCFDYFVITCSWRKRAAVSREGGGFLGNNSRRASYFLQQ
jgi:hypothetical protein